MKTLRIRYRATKENPDVIDQYQKQHSVMLRVMYNRFADDRLTENQKDLDVIMDIDTHSKTGIANPREYLATAGTLNRLRNFKNQIFFASLPKAEEMFS